MWTQGASPVEDHGHKNVQVPFYSCLFVTPSSLHTISVRLKINSLKTESEILPI